LHHHPPTGTSKPFLGLYTRTRAKSISTIHGR
jgi:hypothetical protein